MVLAPDNDGRLSVANGAGYSLNDCLRFLIWWYVCNLGFSGDASSVERIVLSLRVNRIERGRRGEQEYNAEVTMWRELTQYDYQKGSPGL